MKQPLSTPVQAATCAPTDQARSGLSRPPASVTCQSDLQSSGEHFAYVTGLPEDRTGHGQMGRLPGKVWGGVQSPTPSPEPLPALHIYRPEGPLTARVGFEDRAHHMGRTGWTPALGDAASPAPLVLRWSSSPSPAPSAQTHSVTQRSWASGAGAGAGAWTSAHSGCPVALTDIFHLAFWGQATLVPGISLPDRQVTGPDHLLPVRFCVSTCSHLPGLAWAQDAALWGAWHLPVLLRPGHVLGCQALPLPRRTWTPLTPSPGRDPTQREAAVPRYEGPAPTPAPAWSGPVPAGQGRSPLSATRSAEPGLRQQRRTSCS